MKHANLPDMVKPYIDGYPILAVEKRKKTRKVDLARFRFMLDIKT